MATVQLTEKQKTALAELNSNSKTEIDGRIKRGLVTRGMINESGKVLAKGKTYLSQMPTSA